jgi:hypothetical protein
MDVQDEARGGPAGGPDDDPAGAAVLGEPGPASAAGGKSTRPGDGSMTVDIDGTTRRLPAEHDYTGDGLPDAAVETPDGRVIVFSDTEDNETGAAGPDGRADEAWIVDKSTGRAIGTAHRDPDTGGWVVTEPEGGSS